MRNDDDKAAKASDEGVATANSGGDQGSVLPAEVPTKAGKKIKKAPKPPVKKTKFLPISRLSTQLGTTIAKAKVVLASKGYLDQHGKPTKKALDEDAVKFSTTEDKFGNKGVIEYLQWDYLVLEKVFDKPDPITLFCTVRSKSKALDRFCEAFSIAASDLGALELAKWREKHKLSDDAVSAMRECQFSDPHFIGGPFAFEFMETESQVENGFAKAEDVIAEIHAALLTVSKKKADFFRGVVDGLHAWMLNVVRRR